MDINTTNHIGNPLGDPLARPNRTDPARKGLGADNIELTDQYARTIQKALDLDPTNPQAVQQAKHDLENGALDNHQTAQQAAWILLKFGY